MTTPVVTRAVCASVTEFGMALWYSKVLQGMLGAALGSLVCVRARCLVALRWSDLEENAAAWGGKAAPALYPWTQPC